MAVIGAGYIAVELAGIFQELGSATSLFVRGDKALRRFDPIISENLDKAMKKAGMNVVPGSTPKAVTKADDGEALGLELGLGSPNAVTKATISVRCNYNAKVYCRSFIVQTETPITNGLSYPRHSLP